MCDGVIENCLPVSASRQAAVTSIIETQKEISFEPEHSADDKRFDFLNEILCERMHAQQPSPIAWKHQAVDKATEKASLDGKKTGKNPTDRGKLACKRSIVAEKEEAGVVDQ